MKSNQIALALAGCFAAVASINACAEEGIFYEHKTLSFSSLSPAKNGGAVGSYASQNFGVHVIGFFDTTGSITAGLGNAVRQNSARMSKEQEMERNHETTGTYSWQERQPVANDGEFYRIMWSSEGSPWSPFSSMFSTSTTPKDYTPSFLGFEIDHTLWSYQGAPLSAGVGFGTYWHIYNNATVGVSHYDRGSISIPLTFTASVQPLEGLSIYGNAAFGPYGYIKHYATYNHVEAGVTYKLFEHFRLNASYRTVTDYLTQDQKDTSHGQYRSKFMTVGAGYYF